MGLELDAVEVDGLGRVARELLQPLAVLLAARVVVIGEQVNAVVALAALQRRGNGPNLASKLAFSATVIGVANPRDEPCSGFHITMILMIRTGIKNVTLRGHLASDESLPLLGMQLSCSKSGVHRVRGGRHSFAHLLCKSAM